MKRGGRSLFTKHSSLERLLRALYPAFSWDSTKFAEIGGRVPHGFWANVTNQRNMLDKIGKELGIKKVLQSWQLKFFSNFPSGRGLVCPIEVRSGQERCARALPNT